jgi:hypothetical protein
LHVYDIIVLRKYSIKIRTKRFESYTHLTQLPPLLPPFVDRCARYISEDIGAKAVVVVVAVVAAAAIRVVLVLVILVVVVVLVETVVV